MAGGKNKQHQEEPENAERWLLTYADLITLLLGLFVILYAMSNIDKAKYHDFIQAFGSTLGGKTILPGQKGVFPHHQPEKKEGEKSKTEKKSKINKISRELAKLLEEQIASGQVKIIDTPEGVSLHLRDLLFFETGKADIRTEAIPLLDKIVLFLENFSNYIRVEGHTDDVPIKTHEFPTNWHLSIARAMNIGYYIIEQGITPQRVSISGYSEYHPIVPNTSEENREKNRRVEIVILANNP
jgi:chemotaxis protein MotB